MKLQFNFVLLLYMENYFFKFLVLFVIVLTFLYIISNTKEFFSSGFETCNLRNNSYVNKDGSCNVLQNNTNDKVIEKKIDVVYQYGVVKDTEINAPNSHNIVFKNVFKDGNGLSFNGEDSLVYIPDFSNFILFSEIKFNSNDVRLNKTIIGSQDWSIDIKDSNIVLLKYVEGGYFNEYFLKTGISSLTDYTLFIKCNNNLIEIYIDGEKIQRQGLYTTKSIMIGASINKNKNFHGKLSNIVVFNYQPESSELNLLETGKNLLPEKVDIIARSSNNSVEISWIISNTEARATTDFYIIVYENNVGPKIIKYKNRQCENCKYKISNLENFVIYKFGVVGINEFGVGEISNMVQISPGSPLDKFNIPTKAQKVICLNNGLYEVSNRCKSNPEVLPNYSDESYNQILKELEVGKNRSFNLNLGEKINSI